MLKSVRIFFMMMLPLLVAHVQACSVDEKESLRQLGIARRAKLHPSTLEPDQLDAKVKLYPINSNDFLLNNGLSCEAASAVVLDVCFDGNRDLNLLAPPEILVQLCGKPQLTQKAHGTTVSQALAGRSRAYVNRNYQTYLPLARGSTVVPLLSDQRPIHLDRGRGLSTINKYVLDSLERYMDLCKVNNVTTPRVINMSLAMVFQVAYLKEDVARLTRILRQYDMIIVKAIGNLSRILGPDNDRNPYGTCTGLDDGHIDITSALNNYPELRDRIILVGGAELHGREYKLERNLTNYPGALSDHTVFADSVIAIDGTSHGGTSHSTPRVSSLLVALATHFPEQDMATLRRIVLSTCHKPKSYLTEGKDLWGMGVVHPLAAWRGCVIQLLADAPQKPNQNMPHEPGMPADFNGAEYVHLHGDLLTDQAKSGRTLEDYGRWHYDTYGRQEGRAYKKAAVPEDFNGITYVLKHGDLQRAREQSPMSMEEYGRWHYQTYGRNEGRAYK